MVQKALLWKPFNMAQDGPGSDEWWVNMLLVFNVDGRAYNRDLTGDTSYLFPSDMRSDYKTVDDAWVAARKVLDYPDFSLPCVLSLVLRVPIPCRDKNGDPVVQLPVPSGDHPLRFFFQ